MRTLEWYAKNAKPGCLECVEGMVRYPPEGVRAPCPECFPDDPAAQMAAPLRLGIQGRLPRKRGTA